MSDPNVIQNQSFPNPLQDRVLDANTVSWFCIGCPWLGLKNNVQGNPTQLVISSGNGSIISQTIGRSGDNRVPFESEQRDSAPMFKMTYVCTSPKKNFNQEISTQYSTLGIGFCPFLEQKMDLLYDHASDEGGT